MQRLLIGTEIEDWVQRVREELDLPARLSLWTGHTFALGSFDTPAVEIRVRDAAALPLLLESSLDTLGEAYLKQHIDVEGNPADIVDVARRLSSLCGPPCARAVVC
jgi:cyclopropane-fatty-acyl-phospholipid synthase